MWKSCWNRLDTQSDSWYNTPSGAVGLWFTEILDAEWKGVLNRSWKYERPIFAHVILTKELGVYRARDIRARIKSGMDLWERGLHAGFVENMEAEGADMEGRAAIGGKEEDKTMDWKPTSQCCQGNLFRPSVEQPTGRGEGVSFRMIVVQRPGDRLQRFSRRSTRTCKSPPWKILCEQHSKNRRNCPKRYPLISHRMT